MNAGFSSTQSPTRESKGWRWFNRTNATGSPNASGFRLGKGEPPSALGDFTTSWSVIPVSLVAIGIGVLSAIVALALLRLIGLFTNLFFYRDGALLSFLRPAITWAPS